CDKNNVPTREVTTMEEVLPELDILYMTRVQKERFLDEEEFERLKDSFILNPERMKLAKEDMIVLHPLPRVNEITRDVDNDPRAAYFRQVENGKFVRMALIYNLLEWSKERPAKPTPRLDESQIDQSLRCSNRQCISNVEDVDKLFYSTDNGEKRCVYCEAKVK
ncbi:MAG: aspartate carbamoyltransferase, partial [Alistipes sp.]|nr:aspartate carbamoyltransferase [Alistipes sp.]